MELKACPICGKGIDTDTYICPFCRNRVRKIRKRDVLFLLLIVTTLMWYPIYILCKRICS